MNSENELVSIIIPVYKVENYLHRCVESVLNQSYTNIEIILVDDGSPDSCPGICDEYETKDSRIKVVHKVNRGLSSARNSGIEIMKGNWVTFIDSDDYISKNAIEKMVYVARITSSDLVIGNYQMVFDFSGQEKNCREKNIRKFKEIEKKEFWLKILLEDSAYCSAWGKLYKNSLFQEIRYPEENDFGEDMPVIPKIIEEAERISFLEDTIYFYCQQGMSLVRSPYDRRKLNRVYAAGKWVDIISKRYPEIVKQAEAFYIKALEDDYMTAYRQRKTVEPSVLKELTVLRLLCDNRINANPFVEKKYKIFRCLSKYGMEGIYIRLSDYVHKGKEKK